ncbi:MAG: DUF4345 domain-containing protein [Rhizobiaceae bacterium]
MFSSSKLLRVVLAFVGLAIIFLGLNVGLGGIQTLGWQGGADFITITDAGAFSIRDSHIRFIGGVWLGVGLIFLAGAVALERLHATLILLAGAIFIGGLARFSAADPAALFDAALLPSLVAELLLFPLIALWVARS